MQFRPNLGPAYRKELMAVRFTEAGRFQRVSLQGWQSEFESAFCTDLAKIIPGLLDTRFRVKEIISQHYTDGRIGLEVQFWLQN